MKRMPFTPPTAYYDERIKDIDEQLCSLIKRRKETSNENPGFPNEQFIKQWASKYSLYEDLLNSFFSLFLNEQLFKPQIEPKGFRRNIPVLKSFEQDEVFYSVTFVRQFENASVVHFNIDQVIADDDLGRGLNEHKAHTFYELSIKGQSIQYDCRLEYGGGCGGHTSSSFIVSPALPDDLTNVRFYFTEYKESLKPTGFEIII
ncbi:hypothetical protein [Paenibacillus sp. GCM10028914]|uniref:hypothetical protein n=1 Tax=Paenibacillus sp. GCM10028914 TaxID=3273416 RepID=UPI003623C51A